MQMSVEGPLCLLWYVHAFFFNTSWLPFRALGLCCLKAEEELMQLSELFYSLDYSILENYFPEFFYSLLYSSKL